MSILAYFYQRYKLRWFEPPYFAGKHTILMVGVVSLQIDFFRYILVLFRG